MYEIVLFRDPMQCTLANALIVLFLSNTKAQTLR